MHIEFADDLVRSFCERRTDPAYPWDSALRRPLMMRIQGLDAALTERDIKALSSMNYTAIDATRGSIRVAGAYRLQIEFLSDTPPRVSIQGLEQQPPTGDRNV